MVEKMMGDDYSSIDIAAALLKKTLDNKNEGFNKNQDFESRESGEGKYERKGREGRYDKKGKKSGKGGGKRFGDKKFGDRKPKDKVRGDDNYSGFKDKKSGGKKYSESGFYVDGDSFSGSSDKGKRNRSSDKIFSGKPKKSKKGKRF